MSETLDGLLLQAMGTGSPQLHARCWVIGKGRHINRY